MNAKQRARATEIFSVNSGLPQMYDERDEVFDTILDFLGAITLHKEEGYKIPKVKYVEFTTDFIPAMYDMKGKKIDYFYGARDRLSFLIRKLDSYDFKKIKEAIDYNLKEINEIGGKIKIGSSNIRIYL